MRGSSSIILLGLVTLIACANSYSKIPDGLLLSDGYHYRKSSSNSNSNSYSQSNQDDAEIKGVFGGQTFTGNKATGYSTTGGSHSQSNSFSSSSFNGAVPPGIIGSSAVSSAGVSTGSSGSQIGFGSLVNPGTASLSLSDNGAGTPTGFPASSYGGSLSESGSSGIKEGATGSSIFVAPGSGSYSANAIQDQSSGSNFGGSSSSESGFSGQPVPSRPSTTLYGPSSSSGQGSPSGSFAASTTFGSPGQFGLFGTTQKGVQYWWNGPNSPFGPNGRPVGNCNSNACSAGGKFDLGNGNVGVYTPQGQVGINVQRNPFLNKGNTGSGSTGFGGSSSVGTLDGSTDQFQSGDVSSTTFAPVSKPGYDTSFGTTFSSNFPSGASSTAGSSSGAFASVIGANNPFLKPGSNTGAGSDSSNVPYLPPSGAPSAYPGTQPPAVITIGSTNPFLKPGSGSSVITPFASTTTARPYKPIGSIPQLPAQTPSPASQSKGGSTGSSRFPVPDFTPQQSSNGESGLSISCSGQGKICVSKNLCVNGKVNTNGQGLMQVRTGIQQCRIDREICCLLDGYSGAPSKVGIVQGVDFATSTSPGATSNAFASSSSFASSSTGNNQLKNSFPQSENVGSSGTVGQSGFAKDRVENGFGQTPGLSSQVSQFGTNNGQSKLGFGQSGFHSLGNSNQPGRLGSTDFNGFLTSKTNSANELGSSSQSGSGLIHVSPTSVPTLITVPGSPESLTGLIGVVPVTGGFFKTTPGNSFNVKENANFGTSSNAGSNAGTRTQTSSGSFSSSNADIKPFIGNTFNNKQNDRLFGYSTDNSKKELSNGESSYKDTNIKTKDSSFSENNGYLPPLGSEPSSNVPSFSRPPQEVNGDASDSVPNTRLPPSNPTPVQEIPPQVGCAAALICVEEKFCSLEGVISPEPVVLSSIQIERRVPLSSCRNPDNGIIGKCCRDPNYVDPWPTGNLPANYSGGFDERGFPTFLNIAKTLPPKKQATIPKTQQSTKTFPNPDLNSFPKLPTFPEQISNIPNQISSGISNLLPNNPFFKPTEKPEIPVSVPEISASPGIADSPPASLPQIPTKPPNFISNFPNLPSLPSLNLPSLNLPSLPSFPNPFEKTNYNSASSNQNPAVLTPYTPGRQCGVKNKVQRPSGLNDVDVAFGEIPWQAMILSTRDRKLLCSGAIVAPNAVLTAAHCVDGLKPSEVSIKSGEWRLGYELKHEEPLPFEIVKVSSIVPHPGYYSDASSYDLAVLFLEHPVALDQHVDTLCIGNSPQLKPGRKCISTGWGKTVLQVNVAGAVMHSIDVDFLSSDSCKQRILNAESHVDIDDTLVCTKAHNQGNNMCQVDIGSPLACDRGDGFYELTGIYSQDTGCLPTNQVATFALIDTDWVKKTLQSPPTVEAEVSKDESLSPSNVDQRIEPHSQTKEQPCDCQKSNLPSEINQYLPPL